MKWSTLVMTVAMAGCGYGFSAGAKRMPAGAEQVFVRPFENRTTNAEAGALVATALRQELARRGAEGGASAPARIEGAILSSGFGQLNANSTIYAMTVEVDARLISGNKVLAETRASRTEDYIAGSDPLESEGRRRTALRRAAAALARDLLERFETP